MCVSEQMGLRQKVKKGIVSIDEAIELAKDYNESIQAWLKRRKPAGVKVSSKETQSKRYKRRNKAKKAERAKKNAKLDTKSAS